MKKQYYIKWDRYTLCNFDEYTFAVSSDYDQYVYFDNKDAAEKWLEHYIVQKSIKSGSIFKIKSIYTPK
jgi:hypothetical protein